MNIKDILRHKGEDVFSVGPGEDATAVSRALAQHRIGAALVRDLEGRGARHHQRARHRPRRRPRRRRRAGRTWRAN